MSHSLLAAVHSFLLALFFAALWRRKRSEQIRLFLQIFVGLFLGYVLLGWIMYFFPSGPPSSGS